MNMDDKLTEQIDNYLSGMMEPDEAAAFKIMLDHDESLRNDVDFRVALTSVIEAKEQQQFISALKKEPGYYFDATAEMKQIVQQAHDDYFKLRPGKNKTKAIIIWAVVTSVAAALLIVVANLILFKPKNNNIPGGNTSTVKNNTTRQINFNAGALDSAYNYKDAPPKELPLLMVTALTNYRKENYTALQQFDLQNVPQLMGVENNQSVNSKNNILQLGHYFTGITYIGKGGDSLALANLTWVKDSAENKEYRGRAAFYIAAIALKKDTGNKQAIADMQKIEADSTNRFNGFARLILANKQK